MCDWLLKCGFDDQSRLKFKGNYLNYCISLFRLEIA